MEPRILARLRDVPSRALAALLTFGLIFGVPGLLVAVGIVLAVLDVDLAFVPFLCAGVAFFAGVIAAWFFLLTAKTRTTRAEEALYRGDFDGATRDAHFVLRTVFRADAQTKALYTLALSAERLGAFYEAGALFVRVLEMVPVFAAPGPGRRVRSLASAHAALDFSAAGDALRAHDMLARCYRELGSDAHGFSLFRMDDSAFGAIGINAALNELEARRDPRPIAVLAAAFVAYRSGDPRRAYDLLMNERASVETGLAPHERALADRLVNAAPRGPVEWANLALGT